MKKPIVFGKYLLLERINVGGMAEVFIAKSFGVEGFQRILAIKRILPTMAEDEEFIAMFLDEARICAELAHANIVHIFELAKHDQSLFLAMEYVAGKDMRSLQDYFGRREEPVPVAQAAYIAAKICEGLDYAHRKKDARGLDLNIIHRDITPQNILVSYEGEVKIIDFGIAKAANRVQKTETGILKGKFGYMSPEQVQGLPIDRRSDIFAVGVILFEMLTGQRLFAGSSDFSTLERVRSAQVPSPRSVNPNLPEALERVILKALALEPDDRYAWASDLQEDLQRFVLEGDTLYSGKQLSAFMKDAFAEDVLREAERIERFAKIERPEDLESSTLNAPMPRRPSPQVTPAPLLGRLSSPGRPAVAPQARAFDGDEDEPPTQIVDPSMLGFAGPPVLHPVEPRPSPSRAPVVLGGSPAYSGDTVVGPAPTADRPGRPGEPPRPAGETRLRAFAFDDETGGGQELPSAESAPPTSHLPAQGQAAPVRPGTFLPGRREGRPSSLLARVAAGGLLLLALPAGALLYRTLHAARIALVVTVSPLDSAIIYVGARPVPNNHAILLPPGDYTISARAPGYEPWQEVVHLSADRLNVGIEKMLERVGGTAAPQGEGDGARSEPPARVAQARPPPEPRVFAARFESDPPNAHVWVDGKLRGKTPALRVDGLAARQPHTYSVRKPGYRSITDVLTAGEREVSVHAVLEPESAPPRAPSTEPGPGALAPKSFGSLLCSSNPAGAEIWVDNRDTGKQTPRPKSNPLRLPAGKHVVVFRLDGRKSQPQQVTIEENAEEHLINVPLE